jgi:hypothetical protein
MLWVISRLLSLSLLAVNREARSLTDVVLYHNRSLDAWRHGLLPGRDYPSEYPPGALPFVLMPTEIKHAVPYTVVFACQVLLFDGLVFALLLAKARSSGYREGLWLWLCAVPLMGPLVFARLDMIPTALCVVALGIAATRPRLAGSLLGTAALVKLWPLVALAAVLRLPQRGRLLGAAAAAMLGGLVVAGMTGVLTALTTSAQIQAERGVQAESFAALVPLWRRALSHEPLHTEVANYAVEVVDRGSTLLAPALFYLTALAGLLAVIRCVRGGSEQPSPPPALMAALLTALLLVGDKVFSPQYLLWVFGLIGLALSDGAVRSRLMVVTCALLALLSHVVFPLTYLELLQDGRLIPLLVLTLRDFVLLGLVGLLYRAAWPLHRKESGMQSRRNALTA